MPIASQTWLPTTKKQSVLVYALNVLLLFNVTVILVLLSGMDEPTHQRANAPQPRVTLPSGSIDRSDPAEVLPPQHLVVEAPVATEPPTRAIPSASSPPAHRLSSDPFVLADTPAEQDTTQTSAQPETPADPPVTFFGVGLDVD